MGMIYRNPLVVGLCLSLCCFSAVLPLKAQRAGRLFDGYAQSVWYDTRDLVLFPRSLQKDEWWSAGMAVALTGSAFLVDEAAESAIRESHIRNRDPLWMRYAITNWGSGINTGALTATIFTIGAVRHNDRLKWMALLQAKTLGISALGAGFTKLLFQRHRPEAYTAPPDAWRWEGPVRGATGNYSFVSSHAFSAFAWATVTAKSVESKALRVILYSLAGSVGISRVMAGRHWASDVVAGSALGWFTGSLLYRLQEKNWKKKPQRSLPQNNE